MKDYVTISIKTIPRFGEILLGVGGVFLENKEKLLDNEEAVEKIKKYLINEAPKSRSILGVSKSEAFQEIVSSYIGKRVCIGVLNNSNNDDKTVNLLLLDFFSKAIWPILVKRYMESIREDVAIIEIPINIKQNAYITIYDENNPNIIFTELKEFLLTNYIVISGSSVKTNGDLLVNVLVPVVPHRPFDC